MAKKSKGFIYFLLLILAFAVPDYVEGTGTIPDGKYAVKATTLSASSDEVSRLNNSLVNPLNVVVEKGKINVYLTLSRPKEALNTLRISNDAGKSFQDAVLISSSESTTQYMFSVNHLDEPIFSTIYVDAMGATPLFRIAFDKSDVEKMKIAAVAEEKPKQEQPVQEAAAKAAPQQEKKTADQKPAAVEAAAKPAVQEQTAVEQPATTEEKESEKSENNEESKTETTAEESQAEENPTEKSFDSEQKTGSSKMIFVMGAILGLVAVAVGNKLLLKK